MPTPREPEENNGSHSERASTNDDDSPGRVDQPNTTPDANDEHARLSLVMGMKMNGWIWLQVFALGMSGIMLAFLLACLGSQIGQSKWPWFARRDRALGHIETVDSASRGGAWATSMMLYKLRRSLPFTQVASCLAVILALAFDPFGQKALEYHTVSVVSPSISWLTNSFIYTAHCPPHPFYGFIVSQVLRSNVFDALATAAYISHNSHPIYYCFSGNCTWGPMASLRFEASDDTKRLTNCSVGLPESNMAAWFVQREVQGGIYDIPSMKPFIFQAINPSQALVYRDTTTSPIQLIAPRLEDYSCLSNLSVSDNPLSHNLRELSLWGARECVLEPNVEAVAIDVKFQRFYVTSSTYGALARRVGQIATTSAPTPLLLAGGMIRCGTLTLGSKKARHSY
ncbi:hypothetical protein BDW69DRAFT_183872 [Aspergillus filifer]